MTRLQVRFHFAVADLCITPELIGREYDFSFGGRLMFIRFPQSLCGFEDQPGEDGERVLPALDGGLYPDGREYRVVGIVRIGVWFETKLDVTVDDDAPGRDEVMLAMCELHAAAQRALKAYLDVVAIRHDQFWLGTRAELPQPTGTSRVHLEDGTPTNFGYGGMSLVSPSSPGLDEYTQAAVFDEMNRSASADGQLLPESFLRDARALLVRSEADPAHALICAAIACEVKAKRTALTGANQDELSRVEEMLADRPSIRKLFDAVCKVGTGRSLKERDQELYSAVLALFDDRNKIAHGGYVPGLDIVKQHVNTAIQLLSWLDSLAPTQAEA